MTRRFEPTMQRLLSPTGATLAVIAISGFFLRVFQLGKDSLWVDEGFTYRLAQLTLPEYIDNVMHTVRNILPPLYFQMMHYWAGLFGYSEFSLRFPSVIFGTLSILGIYVLGKRLFNKEVGLISALLLALSLLHIFYSQEARMYELLTLLSIASFYLLVKFTADNTWSSACLLAIVNVLLAYTHYYGFFIVFSEYVFAAVLFVTRRGYFRSSIVKWLTLTAAFLVLVLPWVYVFVNQAGKVAKDPWLPPPSAKSLLSLVTDYAGETSLLVVYALLIVAWLLSEAFLPRPESGKESPRDYSRYALLLSWLLVPVLLAFAYSKAVSPIFGNKYLIASSVPFYFLIANAISAIRWKYLKYGVLAAVVVLCLMIARQYHSEIHKEQWREATAFVEGYAQPDDLVLFNAGFGLENGFDYYSEREDLVARPFPEGTRELNTPVTSENMPELLDTVRGHDRVWVVYCHSRDYDDLIRKTILKSYREKYGAKEFVNIRVRLFERK